MIKLFALSLIGSLAVPSFALDTSSFYNRKFSLFQASCKSNGKEFAGPKIVWVFLRGGMMLDYSLGTPVEKSYKIKGNTIMISGFNHSDFTPVEITPDAITFTVPGAPCPGNQQAEMVFGTGDPDPGQW